MKRPQKDPLPTLLKSTIHVAKDTALRVELALQLGEAANGCLSFCGELELVAGARLSVRVQCTNAEGVLVR